MTTNSASGNQRILVEVRERDIVAVLRDAFGDEVLIPLEPLRVGRQLGEMSILLATCGDGDGTISEGLQRHFEEHFGSSQVPSGKCEFCKLQGKILASGGRRRLTEREDAKRVIPAQGEASAKPVVFIREGVTSRAAEEHERRVAEREAARARQQPTLPRAARKGGNGVDMEDLVDLF